MTSGQDAGVPVDIDLKVSVCIPTYNSARTLRKCLEAILNQTMKPHEILVIDGHSQDETLNILREYPTVKVLGFAKGIGKARRALASSATGDIIAWIDSDIIVPLNWIELNVQVHRERKDVMILSGRGQNISEAAIDVDDLRVHCELTPVIEMLGSSQAACTMKRKLFSLVNYDERFKRSEDWELIVSAHRKGIRSHYCDGLKYYHVSRLAKTYLKDMIYAGTYILFLKKYHVWYIRFSPKHFSAFALRIALIYAVPFSFLFPPVLLIYPLAWIVYAIEGKSSLFSRGTAFKFVVETVKGIGEHLYLFEII